MAHGRRSARAGARQASPVLATQLPWPLATALLKSLSGGPDQDRIVKVQATGLALGEINRRGQPRLRRSRSPREMVRPRLTVVNRGY
jgi:hypothetical protein